MREKEKFHSGIFRRIWERTHLWLWLSSLALAHSAQNYMTSKGEQTHQSILSHQLCPPCPRHLSIQRQSEKYYLKHPKHLVLPGKKFIFSALEWFFRFKRKFCVCVCMRVYAYVHVYVCVAQWLRMVWKKRSRKAGYCTGYPYISGDTNILKEDTLTRLPTRDKVSFLH